MSGLFDPAATSIIGNELSVDDEKAKLRLVAESARRVWRLRNRSQTSVLSQQSEPADTESIAHNPASFSSSSIARFAACVAAR